MDADLCGYMKGKAADCPGVKTTNQKSYQFVVLE